METSNLALRAAKNPPTKRAGDDLETLEKQEQNCANELLVAKKRLKAHGSFNPQFWSQAAKVETILLNRVEIQRKISLRDFPGPEAEWQKTEEAKALFERIRAQQVAKGICYERQKDLSGENNPKRTLRSAFMKFFTTSKMGLAVKTSGAGKRDKRMQSDFRTGMIEVYGARHDEYDWLWCPVLGCWEKKTHMTAAHLFAYMHGQDSMDAIFGKTNPPELFSPRNGLLISTDVEEYFDCGKIVIVPDLPERPTMEQLLRWVNLASREYRVKLIDPDWDQLDHPVSPHHRQTWRSLNNKRLEFKTAFRPAARYLYFHYCVQVLRHAWQHTESGNANCVLQVEVGKPFWGTPGRYLPKNMLLALVEELGHDYKGLLNGASARKGDDKLLLDVVAKQVKKKRRGRIEDISYDDTESSDSDGDGIEESSAD